MKKLQDLSNISQAFITADKEYNYQPQLTEKLDNHSGDFSEMILLEIALWKTNRYPTITQDLPGDINSLRKSYSELLSSCYNNFNLLPAAQNKYQNILSLILYLF